MGKKSWTWKGYTPKIIDVQNNTFKFSFKEPKSSPMKKKVKIGSTEYKRYDLIKHYLVKWQYREITESGSHKQWIDGEEEWIVNKTKPETLHTSRQITVKQNSALAVRARIKVVLTNKGLDYYNAPGWGNFSNRVTINSIGQSPEPEATLNDDNSVTLTCTLNETYAARDVTHIIFNIIKETYDPDDEGEGDLVRASIFGENDGTTPIALTKTGNVQKAAYTTKLENNGTYYATATIVRIEDGKIFLGDPSGEVLITGSGGSGGGLVLKPDPPTITDVKRIKQTNVVVSFTIIDGMTSGDQYTVQYNTQKDLIDSGSTSTVSGDPPEEGNIKKMSIDISEASNYYFRIKANRNGAESAWSKTYGPIAVAQTPSQPTTWTLRNISLIGQTIRLYVTHNSLDSTIPDKGEIKWYKTSEPSVIHTIDLEFDTSNPDDIDFTAYVDLYIDPNIFTDGDKIKWQARTTNIAGSSNWSSINEISIYSPAELEINLLDSEYLEYFPYRIRLDSGPTTQTVLSISLDIYANESYETTNFYGETVYVNKGDTVFSKLYTDDLSHEFIVRLKPEDIRVESGVEYLIKAKISLNSGQTGEAESTFGVSLEDSEVEIECEIHSNDNSFEASIFPSAWIDGEELDEEGDPIPILADNVKLGVHRLNYDGSFTTIANGIVNSNNNLVSDPHMPMRNGMYRITVMNSTNGKIIYEDFTVDEELTATGIIIQWDELYRKNVSFMSDINSLGSEEFEILNSFGTFIHLPYNVRISDNSSKDVELVEFQGRESPVTFYGTQKGQNGTWSSEFEKSDKETIYKLRRLNNYPGDVYVREQSGIGYWANITVSMNLDYDNLLVPVTLNITKVDSDRI